MKWEREQKFLENHPEKQRERNLTDIKPDNELTDKKGYLLRRFIEAKWEQVTDFYDSQQKTAKTYYKKILKGCRTGCKRAIFTE